MKLITSLICLLLVFTAPAFGFNRGKLAEQVGKKKPVYTDDVIKKARSQKANLPKNFTLAIYLHNISYRAKWTAQDRKALEAIFMDMKQEISLQRVLFISARNFPVDSIEKMRYIAATLQADAVLEVRGFLDDNQETRLSTFANLWDVRNGFLYFTAYSEAVSKKYGGSMQNKDFAQLKGQAVQRLKKEITIMIQGK